MVAGDIYCLDTSSMIFARNEAYPPRAFKNLWLRIERVIDDQSLMMPEEVLGELYIGADEAYKYAKSKNGFVVSLDTYQINAAQTLVNKYPNMVNYNTWKNSADPFLIALAQVRKAVVITQEKVRNEEQLRVPNICRWNGVRCINFVDFLAEQEWDL